MTRPCSVAERHALAGKVAINGFLLLLGSLLRRLARARVLRHHPAGGAHRRRPGGELVRLEAAACQRGAGGSTRRR
ncbi:MAG: hypothetical protein WDO24_09695 [Pseudomonadota bacterium]